MTIKSQDDLNKLETHSTEVLLSTIDELERTKKQLEIAKDALNLIKEGRATIINPRTRKVEYIESYALEKIEELENANWKMDNMD